MTHQDINQKFNYHFEDAVRDLRSAIAELYDQAGVDPGAPQKAARILGLNKTLTWNLHRLLQADDPIEALPHIPGTSSFEKVARAIESRGVPRETVERFQAAVRGVEEMIRTHAGDRASLDLLLDNQSPQGGEVLELSRKLAFRGDSGIYGVQVRTKLMCCFLAPNAQDPGRLDMAQVNGHVGFRRFREAVRWPLVSTRMWADENDNAITQRWQPIEATPEGHLPDHLMHSFTSGCAPHIEEQAGREGIDYVLQPGPIGNAGAFDCFCGEYLKSAASRYRAREDDTGEFGVIMSTPAENLVFDLLVHRDLSFAMSPSVLVFGRTFPHGDRTGGDDDPARLPIQPRIQTLLGSPPTVATPLIPRYSLLVKAVAAKLHWDLSEFRGVRLELKYPPFRSTVLMRFLLPAQSPA